MIGTTAGLQYGGSLRSHCQGRLDEARRRGLTHLLDGWQPERNPELAALLTKLCQTTLGDGSEQRHIYHRGFYPWRGQERSSLRLPGYCQVFTSHT